MTDTINLHQPHTLDWRTRLETADCFLVTYGGHSVALNKTTWSAETFQVRADAFAFHDERTAKGLPVGVVMALRADGSVIGVIPTPQQEREINARARAELIAECGLFAASVA